MAAANMPPRQKMINMMYLVLTAILALNVSKEVLDAFAFMDTELVRSEHAHEQRSQVEYTVFADAAKRFPEKFGDAHDRMLSGEGAGGFARVAYRADQSASDRGSGWSQRIGPRGKGCRWTRYATCIARARCKGRSRDADAYDGR
jgi:hypothetical protein